MKKQKICVITGSRADYSYLRGLMKQITEDPELELQVITTGSHLSEAFGLTGHVIEADGFPITAQVDILSGEDTPAGVTRALGRAVLGFADAFERLKPEWVLLLGDRYEILAAAQSALIARIPVAHIAGGDVTEGALDEAIRHSITKIAHLHFVTNEAAASRVRQLGEDPECVFNVGSPSLDEIRVTRFLDRAAFEKTTGFRLQNGKNLLVTFHPCTLDEEPSERQLDELFKALKNLGESVGLIFTKPNADTGGLSLGRCIESFAAKHRNAKAFVSMGQPLYWSAMNLVDAVVGNSSSGIYEAPSFKKPTVNIGDRQKGRPQAASIINCRPKADEILAAIRRAFTMDCSNVVNPYGDGFSSERIYRKLKEVTNPRALLKKHFFDLLGETVETP